MENIELLVHITAPARRQDDTKYLALAQSIIDFEPATLTRGLEQENGNVPVSEEGRLHLRSSSVYDGFQSPTSGASSIRDELNAIALPRPTFADPNPPYKNPYHGVHPNPHPRPIYETPQASRRPQTAPEQSANTIQVPLTRSSLRRTHSDSTSFGSLASHVSNSQPSQLAKGDEFIASESLRVGSASFGRADFVRSPSQTSLREDGAPPKRQKLNTMQYQHVVRHPQPAGPEAMDWTLSPVESSQTFSESVPSTATPSQPLTGKPNDTNPVNLSPSPVVIISSDSSKQVALGQTEHYSSPVISSERRLMNDEVASQTGQEESTIRSFFTLRGLQAEVPPPEPAVGNEQFVTHITRPLQEFASQLPFGRFFRPTEVLRDVRVLERGHWLMKITIVPQDVAEAARSVAREATKPLDMHERFQGTTAAARLAKYEEAKRNGSLHQSGSSSEIQAQGLWTEEELVQFWKSLASFIENGKAGWGTRMVGEEISEDSSEGHRQIRIRIFTWGEVLGHIYLAVWVLSDKLADRIPMQWISSDMTPVVTMSGTRSGRGSLPPWCKKGPDGEKGWWGVADSTRTG